jgi:hypothetical protein
MKKNWEIGTYNWITSIGFSTEYWAEEQHRGEADFQPGNIELKSRYNAEKNILHTLEQSRGRADYTPNLSRRAAKRHNRIHLLPGNIEQKSSQEAGQNMHYALPGNIGQKSLQEAGQNMLFTWKYWAWKYWAEVKLWGWAEFILHLGILSRRAAKRLGRIYSLPGNIEQKSSQEA